MVVVSDCFATKESAGMDCYEMADRASWWRCRAYIALGLIAFIITAALL